MVGESQGTEDQIRSSKKTAPGCRRMNRCRRSTVGAVVEEGKISDGYLMRWFSSSFQSSWSFPRSSPP